MASEVGHFSLMSFFTSTTNKVLLIFLAVWKSLYTDCCCSVCASTLTEALVCDHAANYGTE